MNLKTSLFKHMLWFGGGLVLLNALACRPLSPAQPTPTSTAVPVVSLDALQFSDALTGERFGALDACIANLVDESWQRRPYELIGNFYEAAWCRGNGARSDCQITSGSRDDRDQHTIHLYTLFYPQSYPQVFGLGLNALWVPATPGWGAQFYFSEGGQSTVGEGFGLTFLLYSQPSGPPQTMVTLGDTYQYKVQETMVNHATGLPLREHLALYLASPEALRENGLAQFQAIAVQVEQTITLHQAQACEYGEPPGGGIPPPCTLRPLTAAEEADELAKAQAHFAGQQHLLDEQYQVMYQALMTAFPLDQCWP